MRRFVEEGGAVVTTGQQAGLFTGPLYTIYKILSTVRLAAELETDLGILVLPVFWSASEDHDWEEVNHTYVVGPDDDLHRLAVSSSDPRPLPMSERILEGSIESTLDELAQLLAPKEFASDYLMLVRGNYQVGASVAAAFRKTIEALFAPFDLLVADAADQPLKERSVPVLTRAIADAAEHEVSFAAGAEVLLRAGYHVQVSPIPGAANLFFHGEAGRERLHHVRGQWITRESREHFDTQELLRRIQGDPRRFSPNVALRPVVESSVFPAIAYVAGPGEISYFAQLRGLFAASGIRMPIVYPRFSAALVPDRVRGALEKLALTAAELARPHHELLTRLARAQIPDTVAAELAKLRGAVADGYARLIEASAVVDPTLAGSIGSNRNRALRDLARSEQKILQQIKRHEVLLNRRLDQVRAYLHPTDAPQDRVLNIFPFLAEEGSDLLHRLASQVRIPWQSETPPQTAARG
ncbi:bacillithiol biosynthesis cysteine-adding enzyme BshC [soil metagenome]